MDQQRERHNEKVLFTEVVPCEGLCTKKSIEKAKEQRSVQTFDIT